MGYQYCYKTAKLIVKRLKNVRRRGYHIFTAVLHILEENVVKMFQLDQKCWELFKFVIKKVEKRLDLPGYPYGSNTLPDTKASKAITSAAEDMEWWLRYLNSLVPFKHFMCFWLRSPANTGDWDENINLTYVKHKKPSRNYVVL